MATPARTLIASDRAEALSLAENLHYSEAGIVSRTLLQSPEMRIVLFAFSEGQELTLHSSRRRAFVHVLEGECEFFFADRWQRLKTGSVLHLPPSHPHAVKAGAGPFAMLLTLGAEMETPDGAGAAS